MKRLGTLTLQFYQLLLVYNIAFSVLAAAITVFDSGSINVSSFLYAKVVGFACAVGLHYYSAKDSYFYFRNAGYSIWQIFLSAFAVDIVAYSLVVTLLPLILHECLH